ncbi:MAG TPA: hypothetical protein VI431_15420 [Candidatus Acidoferrum sp.]
MEPRKANPKRRKQQVILAILTVLLFVIVLSPTISLGVQALFPRAPTQLGAVPISVPKTWMLSRDSTRVTVWKPCITIFCHSSQGTFVLEVKDLPEDVWEHAAAKILRDNYSGEVVTTTINRNSELVKCVELQSTLADGKVVASCVNSDLHLTSTFVGKPSLRPVFYSVLVTAHKSP